MKKIVIYFLLILTAVTSLSASSYEDAKMTRNALKTLGNLSLKHDFTKIYVNSAPYYAMKYNGNTSDFIDLYNVSIDGYYDFELKMKGKKFPKSGSFIQINSNSSNDREKGVCVSFINATSTLTLDKRSTAIHGQRLYPNANIKAGTVIVTRAKKGKSGHIAIILSVKEKYIWVINQNAYYHYKNNNIEKGIVSINRIYFGKKITDKNNNAYYKHNNAYNYYVVRIKK